MAESAVLLRHDDASALEQGRQSRSDLGLRQGFCARSLAPEAVGGKNIHQIGAAVLGPLEGLDGKRAACSPPAGLAGVAHSVSGLGLAGGCGDSARLRTLRKCRMPRRRLLLRALVMDGEGQQTCGKAVGCHRAEHRYQEVQQPLRNAGAVLHGCGRHRGLGLRQCGARGHQSRFEFVACGIDLRACSSNFGAGPVHLRLQQLPTVHEASALGRLLTAAASAVDFAARAACRRGR